MSETSSQIFETSFSELSKAYLLETTRWTRFLAIFGFIGTGFMLLIFLGVLTGGGAAFLQTLDRDTVGGSFYYAYTIGMLFSVLVNGYFSYLLYTFSTKTRDGIESNNTGLIEDGFRRQKTLYKSMAIFLIVFLVIYIFILAAIMIKVAG